MVVCILDMTWNGALSLPMRKNSKGSIARSNEDGFVFSVPSKSEFSSTFQVSEETNDFGKIALSRRIVVGAGHDDSKLGLESEL